jgi:DNA-binding MarR family transcriptional regulator
MYTRGMRPETRHGTAKTAAGSSRDRMDAMTDAWRQEVPEFERPESEFIRRTARLEQLLEEALSECLLPWNLTRADFNVLSILRTAGAPYELRPTDIRNRLLLTSGGVSNILNRLERLGLAERVPDGDDRRISWVRLTGAGIEVIEDAMRAWSAVQDQMFAGLDPQLAHQASDTLRTILLILGDREPAAAATRQPDEKTPRVL